MNRTAISRLLLFVLVVAGLAFTQPVPGRGTRPAPARLQPPVQAQPGPISAEDKPAVAPQVTCAGGNVTLVAENSTLESVMEAVAGCSGAKVDMPANIGANRVFTTLGPTEAANVFAALLDSSLNYVIVRSNLNAARVQMVVVRPRQAQGAGVGQQPSTAWQSMQAVATQAPVATQVDGNEAVPPSSEFTQDESKPKAEEVVRKDDELASPDPQ